MRSKEYMYRIINYFKNVVIFLIRLKYKWFKMLMLLKFIFYKDMISIRNVC